MLRTALLGAWLLARYWLAPVGDDAVIRNINADRVAEVVAAEGFAVVDTHAVDDNALIHVKINGTNVLLLFGNSGSTLQAYAGFRGTPADLIAVNEWNKSKRFSRAYLDDDGDAVLESDLDLGGGVTEQAIAKFLKTFALSLAAFEHEVCGHADAPQRNTAHEADTLRDA